VKDLLVAQTGSITGEILAVSGKTISVKNDKGVVGDVDLADNFKINTYTKVTATQPKNPKIETGKHVTLLLQVVGDTYKVVTLNYVPPIPSLPKISLPVVSNSTAGAIQKIQ
jgi:hypothetical protein